VAQARTAADRATSGRWFERLSRYGLAAKALLYGLIAVLALGLALGIGGRATDNAGALRTIADAPFGKVLLGLTALGLLGYALYRFAQGAFDREGDGDGASGWAKRATHIGSGFVYLALFVLAVALLRGDGGGSAGNEQKNTADLLGLPAGRWLVGAVGLGILGAGGYQILKGVKQSFMEGMRTYDLQPGERRLLTRIGTVGHIARGIVFGLIGVFLVKAAIEYDASEAIGIDGALGKLANASHGPWLLGVVALGLLAFAAFCLAEARYRRV
jgi:hypothetical protein